MTKLSKLWAMAYSNYVEHSNEATKDQINEMEDTLLYWWTRASCEELMNSFKYLKTKAEARKRLPK